MEIIGRLSAERFTDFNSKELARLEIKRLQAIRIGDYKGAFAKSVSRCMAQFDISLENAAAIEGLLMVSEGSDLKDLKENSTPVAYQILSASSGLGFDSSYAARLHLLQEKSAKNGDKTMFMNDLSNLWGLIYSIHPSRLLEAMDLRATTLIKGPEIYGGWDQLGFNLESYYSKLHTVINIRS